MTVPFDWVDAFSDKAFSGNGCAVVYEDGAWSDARCMAFTRETSLVECTFISPSDKADWKVRYFLASGEIPFAGHPTIASAISLFDRGKIKREAVLETGAGLIPISIKDEAVQMRQNAPDFGQEFAREQIAELLNIPAAAIIDAPQRVSTGLPFIITLVDSLTTLEAAHLDLEKRHAFHDRNGFSGVMEPYLVTLDCPNSDSVGRLLLPPPNPPEDPFTGSASGAMAAYLWARGHITKEVIKHSQGHMLGREGSALLERIGSADKIEGVYVSGKAHILMRGEVSI